MPKRSHTDDEAKATLFGTVFALAQHLGRLTDEALAPLDLTSRQWFLLAVLSREFPGRSPTLSEAAARYGSSRQNVKQIALQLERRGYLDIAPDPDDRRALRLALRPKVAIFDEPALRRRQEALFATIFDGLSNSDIRTMAGISRHWVGKLGETTD